MNLHPFVRIPRPHRAMLVLAAGLTALLGTVAPAAGQGRVVVGRANLLSSILHREGPGMAWKLIRPRDPVYSEDLLVAVPLGALTSKNGNVRLSLLSDLGRLSPFPVLESGVILHDSPDVDLDVTIDRGRVDVTNLRRDGKPAKVRVRFHKEKWELTLQDENARVGFELYGRWHAGAPFNKEPKPGEEPSAELIAIVIKGQVDLNTGRNRFALHEPPGPAYFHWDNEDGDDKEPHRLEELPGWARPGLGNLPRARDIAAVGRAIQSRIAQGAAQTVEDALVDTLKDKDNPNARRIAIYGLGAVDDLPHLVDALGNEKFEDVRETAILALRHWIGRGPGQDRKLYDALVKEKGYSEGQAAIVLQLLHGFSDAQLAHPATYETLIDYLGHDKLAIRELAKFHLTRLVPAGRDIAFDPAASADERQKGIDKWRQLIPAGKLPPKEKP